MDEKTEKILAAVKYLLLAAAAVFTAVRSDTGPWAILALSALLAVSMTLRNALVYPSEKYRNAGLPAAAVDILLAGALSRLDGGNSSEFIFFVIILDISFTYSVSASAITTAACFAAFTADYLSSSSHTPSDLLQLSYHFMAFLTAFAVIYIARHELAQRNALRTAMYELKLKTRQLENTNRKLKDAYQELEEMAVMEERTRIARDIHDTVGHTLTTALVELEAGNLLLETSPRVASEKINLAKNQIRRGLSDIRDSVKLLKAGIDSGNFIQSAAKLLEDAKVNNELYIKYELSEIPSLTQAQAKALYRALQEGITNGIRHGKSSAFVVRIKKENELITFLLQDNGAGCSSIKKGFGLMSMEERVRELGGMLLVTSEPGEGFTIHITLPLQKEVDDEPNQNSHSR